MEDKVNKDCKRYFKELENCRKEGKKCERYEVKVIECVSAIVSVNEFKSYSKCKASIMGQGFYNGRRDCNLETTAALQCVQQYYQTVLNKPFNL